MSLTVAVAGATGYAGGEILRLLLNHPRYLAGELEIGALTGNSNAGQSVVSQMPHLPQLADRVIEETTAEALAGHDVVFLALPHGHSAQIAKQLADDVVVLDCAADYRLHDQADWDHYYGGEYAGHWPYGIPEMPGHREEIRGATRIAIPGCFPTSMTLTLLPAVKAGLIEPTINIVSITGTSGAGKKAAVPLLGSETIGNLRAYNTSGKHRHNPEIVQNLREYSDDDFTVSFTPVLAPMARGILTTATATVREGVTDQELHQAYLDFYREEPFVHVLPAGQQPETSHVVGSNACHVNVELNSANNTVLMTGALDNLTKGTAGAAVQCMNLALDWDETAGLAQSGLAP